MTTSALTLDSRLIAEELHDLLREIDPARWRDDLEGMARQRFRAVQARLADLLDGTDPALNNPTVAALRDRLREVSHLIELHLPEHGLPVEVIQQRWDDFRLATMPAYEQLASHLKNFDIHVPSLRPTNYTRNLFHAGNGLIAVLLVQHVLTVQSMLWVAGAFAASAWTLEGTRRLSKRWNDLLMVVFKRVAHPHEWWRVNSATWFSTALLILALLHDPMVGTIALVVLSFADPAAALVGRRYGTVKLVHGRTLEGSLAFFGVGTLAAFAVMSVYYPAIPWGAAVLVSVGAAMCGGLAELFSRRIDDNLSVPVCAAGGALLVTHLLGM